MVRLHNRPHSLFSNQQRSSGNTIGGSNNMLLAASCGYFVALAFGYVIGYSSPALPDMERSKLLATGEGSIFGALITIGGCFGSLIAGWTVEKFGRKRSLVLSCIPMIIGWVLIFMTGPSTINVLFLGRLLTGVACGAGLVLMSVYVAETCTKEYRGMLGAGVQLGIVSGVLVVYVLGMMVGWRTLAMLGIVFPISAIYVSTKVPETPRWYLLKSRRAEAIRALQQLRATMDVEEELAEIEDGLPNKGDRFSISDLSDNVVWKPLKVGVMLMIFQQLSGINVVMFYTVSIFESAGLKGSSMMATIAVGAVQVIATLGAVHLMDRAGRRPLLFLGGFIMSVSCFTMALYYHWAAAGPIPNLTWMALASLIFYIIGFSIGWGPIPGLVMSEIFPLKAKGAGSAITCLSNWSTAFIVTSQFMNFVAAYGQASGYAFFGIATAIGTILVYLQVPETKGKSLEEIELYFLGRTIHGKSIIESLGSNPEMQSFSIVAAMLPDRGIGYKNTLPWPSLKKDYQHYIKLTSTPSVPGKKCVNIKGRLTWESTGYDEKSNPNIINIVISTTLTSCPEFVSKIVSSLDEALSVVALPPYSDIVDSVWVMGGETVYKEALLSPLCDRVYLTKIDAQFECDSFFPNFEHDFQLVSLPDVDSTEQEDNGISYRFQVYEPKRR